MMQHSSPVAPKMVLQVARQDIGQLTYVELLLVMPLRLTVPLSGFGMIWTDGMGRHGGTMEEEPPAGPKIASPRPQQRAGWGVLGAGLV
jgi:hypothetical protein